jgi:hypothetical protein
MIKSWKNFNENLRDKIKDHEYIDIMKNDINQLTDLEDIFTKLTLERNLQYLEHVKKMFEKEGTTCEIINIEVNLENVVFKVNDLPMHFTKSGRTMQFMSEWVGFPKHIIDLGIATVGYRTPKNVVKALKKHGFLATTKATPLYNSGILDE